MLATTQGLIDVQVETLHEPSCRIEPVDQPGRKAPEDIGEKGIMRAGEDDDIGAVAILLIEARRDFCPDGFVVDMVAANMRKAPRQPEAVATA